MNRRGFLLGLIAAPVVIRTPGLLMPIKPQRRLRGIIEVNVTVLHNLAPWHGVETVQEWVQAEMHHQLLKMMHEQTPLIYNAEGWRVLKLAAENTQKEFELDIYPPAPRLPAPDGGKKQGERKGGVRVSSRNGNREIEDLPG